ncbi:MAG: creatininase family protein [Spirochaetes bacterium]|nr:creatininase family protein [Spirochaetota bacterium]
MNWNKMNLERETDLSIFSETMVEMTWQEVENAAKDNSVVLLPIGIVEAHGPHMDLSADVYCSYLFCKLLNRKLKSKNMKSIVAPPFYWGVAKDTHKYAGTFSVRPETMKSLLIDIYASLDMWGFKNVFIVNCHGDHTHIEMIDSSIEEAAKTFKIKVYQLGNISIDSENAPVFPAQREDRFQPDYHAGAVETAFMHAFYPDKVNVSAAKKLKPQNSFDPFAYCGDPANYDLEGDVFEFWEADLETDSLKIESVLKKNS